MSHLPLSSVLGNLQLLETYVYYDQPCLFSCKNQENQLFVAVWVDTILSQDLWLYAPVSLERLRSFRKGDVDVRSVFNNAEESYVWVVSIPHADAPARVAKTPCNELIEDYLPERAIKIEVDSDLPAIALS